MLTRRFAQAAAAHEHPCFHPILPTGSIRDYLRREQLVLSSIFGPGSPAQRPVHRDSRRGCFSPDMTKAAELDHSTGRLVVRGLVSGRRLHVWALPQRVEGYQSMRGWCPSSEVIVLTAGQPWWSRSPTTEAALRFVDSVSGSSTAVTVPLELDRGPHLTPVVCRSHARVLVVLQYRADVAVQGSHLLVYSFSGSLVCQTQHAHSGSVSCSWAPSGQAVLMQAAVVPEQRPAGTMWLWDLPSGSVLHIADSHAGVDLCPWVKAGCIALHLHASLHSRGSLPEQVTTAWGPTVVLLAESDPFAPWGCKAAQVSAVHNGSLVLQQTVLAPGGRLFQHQISALLLSPNGELCGATTSKHDSTGHESRLCLAIIHCATGRLQEYRLQGMAFPLRPTVHLRWRCDGSALLVSSSDQHTLFSFAA